MALPKIFDIGDLPVVTGKFKNLLNQPVDPTSVQVQVLTPAGVEKWTKTSPDASITNSAVGTWVFTFPDVVDVSGDWRVKFYGTGSAKAAEEIVVRVRETKFEYPVTP